MSARPFRPPEFQTLICRLDNNRIPVYSPYLDKVNGDVALTIKNNLKKAYGKMPTILHLAARSRIAAIIIDTMELRQRGFYTSGPNASITLNTIWATKPLEIPKTAVRYKRSCLEHALAHEIVGHGMTCNGELDTSTWLSYLALTHIPNFFYTNYFDQYLKMILSNNNSTGMLANLWSETLKKNHEPDKYVDALSIHYTARLAFAPDRYQHRYELTKENLSLLSSSLMAWNLGMPPSSAFKNNINKSNNISWLSNISIPFRESSVSCCEPTWREAWMNPAYKLPNYVYESTVQTRLRFIDSDFTSSDVKKAISRLEQVPGYYAMKSPSEAIAEHICVEIEQLSHHYAPKVGALLSQFLTAALSKKVSICRRCKIKTINLSTIFEICPDCMMDSPYCRSCFNYTSDGRRNYCSVVCRNTAMLRYKQERLTIQKPNL